MNTTTYVLKYTEYLIRKCRSYFMTDLNFHTAKLKKTSGITPDIKSPTTLSEKICHRLVYDHNNLYTMLADKLAVREYVASRTTRVKVVPLIGVYRRFSHIDFSILPDQFVLKCNHDSGSTIICTNKNQFNYRQARKKLTLALKKNLYYTTREWQYKNITPVILCEPYVDLFNNADRNSTPEMLRIHCFHGVAHYVEADFTDDRGREFINVYDRHWNLQPFQMEYSNTPVAPGEPKLFREALLAAQELAKGLDYCRIDLMLKSDEIYFSEITLSPKRGKLRISPLEWDTKLGDIWQLPLSAGRPG
ncbi:TPA: ATP-grasp fold amidoligase family protein [Enterobacter bugandensis]|uniref:ATP-grasp fold amidoligase family protein n=1 Tax=Enterobacter TaxID=547 RepID=UPI000F88A02A|nr:MULTISPECIES: ATP-grasp fold amidoligase family protein [Enterobacter]EHN8829382.1 glycosyl transferase [Enterobacter bugandensis]EHN8847079.1 glycosyl transferase [Enterobacter bugandensis]MBE4805546.1 glycosyl transferase [Enterobacter cloacae complex sp. P43RS]MCK6700666.1 glycosyl transferase [Enterobacter bugandensis]MCK6777072.1 glycosyl transferase [Enterobacter bugandensis]